MNRKKSIVVSGVIGLFALGMVACSGSSDGDGDSGPKTSKYLVCYPVEDAVDRCPLGTPVSNPANCVIQKLTDEQAQNLMDKVSDGEICSVTKAS